MKNFAWLWIMLSLSVELIKKGVDFALEAIFANAIEAVKSSETAADDKSLLALLEAIYNWTGKKIEYLKSDPGKKEMETLSGRYRGC